MDGAKTISVRLWLKKILLSIDKLQLLIEHSSEYAEPQLAAIGLFGFVGFPLFYIVWEYIFPQPYESFTLRMIGCVLCLLLMLKKYWPPAARRFLSLYWYVTAMYCLPFFFSYMVLMNNWSDVWVLSLLCAVFVMVLLVDLFSLALLIILGTLIAWFVFWVFHPEVKPTLAYLKYLVIFAFAIVAGIIFNYKTNMLKREKLVAMSLISGSIAHELRTPLLGIKSGSVGIKRYLPILFEAYNLAKEAGLPVTKIRTAHYDSLQQALERIESETNNANTIIDMLLMNVGKQTISESMFEKNEMVDCVNEALRRYPFSSQDERNKLTFDESGDFIFYGSKLLIVHVLFNLIKNALHFIAKARKGTIHVWLSSDERYNRLHFKDTGKGIVSDALPRIFERFFSTTISGTGIGLSFCQLVIESFGGTISCGSVYGSYTEFILSLPKELDLAANALQDQEKTVN